MNGPFSMGVPVSATGNNCGPSEGEILKWFGPEVLKTQLPSMPPLPTHGTKVMTVDEIERSWRVTEETEIGLRGAVFDAVVLEVEWLSSSKLFFCCCWSLLSCCTMCSCFSPKWFFEVDFFFIYLILGRFVFAPELLCGLVLKRATISWLRVGKVGLPEWLWWELSQQPVCLLIEQAKVFLFVNLSVFVLSLYLLQFCNDFS